MHSFLFLALAFPVGAVWLRASGRQAPVDFSREETTPCVLCPKRNGGAIRMTNDGRWCHVLCALGISELSLRSHKGRQVVCGVRSIAWSRWKQACSLCGVREGVCATCSYRGCKAEFHMGCAREAGCHVTVHQGYRASVFCAEHTPWPGQIVSLHHSRQADLSPHFKWPPWPQNVGEAEFDGIGCIQQALLAKGGLPSDIAMWQKRLLQVLKDQMNISVRKAMLVYPHWLQRRKGHARGPLLREYDRHRQDEILTRKRRRQLLRRRSLAAGEDPEDFASHAENVEHQSSLDLEDCGGLGDSGGMGDSGGQPLLNDEEDLDEEAACEDSEDAHTAESIFKRCKVVAERPRGSMIARCADMISGAVEYFASSPSKTEQVD